MSKNDGLTKLGRESLHIGVAAVWFVVIMIAAVAIHWVVEQAEQRHLMPPLMANMFGAAAYVLAILDVIRFFVFIIGTVFKEEP